MKTEIRKVDEINPAAYNPRIELKPGDSEFEALNKSVDRFGMVQPLVINETTGNLVSGHQRLNVLKHAGVKEVEVVLIEVDAEKEKLLNIALNKIDGEWDYEKLETLFDELLPEDIAFTGFNQSELDELFGVVDDVDWGNDDSDYHEREFTDNNGDKPFNLFLSFASKQQAEDWLKSKGIKARYEGTNRNVTIRMEGLDYGKGY